MLYFLAATRRSPAWTDGDSLFVVVDRLDCARPGAGLRPHGFICSFCLPAREHLQADQEQARVRTLFDPGPNAALQALNAPDLDYFHVDPLVWPGREQGEWTRVAAVINADRAWAAHVLSVSRGAALHVAGEAEGEAHGEIEVTLKGSAGLRFVFEPDRILAPVPACAT
jgi:hypothetical protein